MKDSKTRQIVGVIQKAEAKYAEMCSNLRSGGNLPIERIEETVEAAGRTWQDVVEDVFTGNQSAVRPGAPCPADCGGRLVTYASKRQAGRRCRYLRCNRCRARPERNKVMVLEEAVPHRRARRS